MRTTLLVTIAAVLAVAAPAQARSGTLRGIVVANHVKTGTIVVVRANGTGATLHTASAHIRVGDRVLVQSVKLRDGTFRASHTRVLSHARRALVRGVVMRKLARSALVSSGRSVIRIGLNATRTTASARDHGQVRVGEEEEFQVRFDDDHVVAEDIQTVAPAGAVKIDGAVVSVSPFVVSLDGLSITITVPAGVTLPPGLAVDADVELTVLPAAGNVFTLVSIDELEGANLPAGNREVEVKGSVMSSSTTQIVISAGGSTFTFTAPNGVSLPIVAVGTSVEARGTETNGALVLERLRVEDDGGGDGGGGDDGGGH